MKGGDGSHRGAPAIFYVNRTANAIAQKLYKKAFRGQGSEGGIWFRCAIDTVYLDWNNWLHLDFDRVGGDVHCVDRLAVCDRPQTGEYDPRVIDSRSATAMLTKALAHIGRPIKKLTLVIPDHKADHQKRELAFVEFVGLEGCLRQYSQVYDPVKDQTFKQFEHSFRVGADSQQEGDIKRLREKWTVRNMGWELPPVERKILTDVKTKEEFEKGKKLYNIVRSLYEESGMFRERGFIMRGTILG